MDVCGKKSDKKILLAFLMTAAVLFGVFGCASRNEINFTVDEIDLFVGESRELFPYASFYPATAKDKSFTLSSDSDCVSVDDMSVTAEKTGSAVVTASYHNSVAKIKINSSYRAPQEIKIDVTGDLVQNTDRLLPVTFSASINDYADPAIDFTWYVNDKEKGGGKTFDFTPKTFGEYVVTAKAAGLATSKVVTVFKPTSAKGFAQGEFNQKYDFSPVRFVAIENTDYSNPKSIYSWRVNGKELGTDLEFEYTPLYAATFDVALYVNGVQREIEGGSVITAVGDREPKPKVLITEDGRTLICWSDGKPATTIIIDGKSYNDFDIEYTAKFYDGHFDATECLPVCADEPKTIEIAVKADSVGAFTAFTQYPAAAQRYLDKKLLFSTTFITSYNQLRAVMREAFVTNTFSVDCYLDKNVSDEQKVLSVAVDEAQALGITFKVAPSVNDNVLSIKFNDFTCGVNNSSVCEKKASSVRQVAPHIEYNEALLRGKDYVFYSDRINDFNADKTMEPKNGDELLLCLQNGFRPIFTKEKSDTEKIYSAAKRVLLRIIGKNYDAQQKVHAIYDWLQFATDRAAASAGDINCVCDYLEGVFLYNADAAINNVISDLGGAKAFNLMCAVEGIKSEITCDISSQEVNGKNTVVKDYYDRVYIDRWYNVDVFDGEVKSGNYDYCTHERLLYPDADATPKEADGAYDTSLSYYLQKQNYNDTYVDSYIEADDDEVAIFNQVDKLFSLISRQGYKVPLSNGTIFQVNQNFYAEFCMSDELTESMQNDKAALLRSAAEKYVENYVKTFYTGGNVDEKISSAINAVSVKHFGLVAYVVAPIPILS